MKGVGHKEYTWNGAKAAHAHDEEKSKIGQDSVDVHVTPTC